MAKNFPLNLKKHYNRCRIKTPPMKTFVNLWMALFSIMPMAGLHAQAADTTRKRVDTVNFTPSIPPSFPGGIPEWRKFLQRNLKGNIPLENGAPAGKYKVMMQFMVERDSTVTSMQPLTSNGFGMEQEVMRLIGKSRWVPAQQNGRVVRAIMRQPVIFFLPTETVEIISPGEEYVLYEGIDNELTVEAPRNYKDISMTIDNGTVRKGEGNKFIVQVKGSGARALVNVLSKDKIIEHISFEIKPSSAFPSR